MFKFIVLLSIAAYAYAASIPNGMLPQLDGRIVGGQPTTIEKFPWQVSLQRSGSHFCGGSLYTNNIVVTAAHCVQSVTASSMQVRVGSTTWNKGGVLVNVAAVKSHERYNPGTMMNDIALLRLASPVTFGSTMKSIPLAEQTPSNGAHAAVSGWGTTFSGASTIPTTLQTVNLKMVNREECASSTYGYGADIKPTMVCAYSEGKDSCQGDSGGPLVSGGRLVGVVSWGYGCAFANYPGIYADVAHLNQWVVDTAATL